MDMIDPAAIYVATMSFAEGDEAVVREGDLLRGSNPVVGRHPDWFAIHEPLAYSDPSAMATDYLAALTMREAASDSST